MAVNWTVEKKVTLAAENRVNVTGTRTDDVEGTSWTSRPLKGIWDTSVKSEAELVKEWAAMIQKQYQEYLAMTPPDVAPNLCGKLAAELQKSEGV